MVELALSQAQHHLAERLSHVLKGTHARAPRPITRLSLPLGLDHVLLRGRWMRRLNPAAVLVAIRMDEQTPRVILTVRSAGLRAHGGQISFPGGRVEDGDQFPDGTALREAREEIGLLSEGVEVIGYLDDYPTVTKFRVTPVVALVRDEQILVPDPIEVSEIFEVPLAFVLERKNYHRKRLGRMGLSYYELHYKRYRIWGATAGMLFNLQEKFARAALA